MARMLGIYRVDGDSMSPRLSSGDYVIASVFKRLKPACIAVVQHPHYGLVIKQVCRINAQGLFQLKGLNAQSISRDQLGWCSPKDLIGVVVKSIKMKSD